VFIYTYRVNEAVLTYELNHSGISLITLRVSNMLTKRHSTVFLSTFNCYIG